MTLNISLFSGASFTTFLKHTNHFESLKAFEPDIVVVILGANDLKASVELSEIYDQCTKFYCLLREFLPKAFIIASQIENRFYSANNRFDSPLAADFDYLRRHFNRFLKNKPFKDCLMQVQGSGRLDSQEYYRDSVHLNHRGLNKYFQFIENTLSFAFNKGFAN